MKNTLFFFLLGLVFSFSTSAQPAVEKVAEAIQAGDASKVARYFDKVVVITLNNEPTTYSKSQAEVVIRSFFAKNNVKDFTVRHKGQPQNESSVFLIGNLSTKEEKNYRVYLFFKEKADSYLLQEIRFEL